MVGLVAGLLLLFPDLFEGERAGREREREQSQYIPKFDFSPARSGWWPPLMNIFYVNNRCVCAPADYIVVGPPGPDGYQHIFLFLFFFCCLPASLSARKRPAEITEKSAASARSARRSSRIPAT